MSTEDVLIANTIAVWKSVLSRADKLFTSLTDEQLLTPVAPGKNRLIYLWGHFVAVHDRMIDMLFVGERVHPGLDAIFITVPDGTTEMPPVSEIRDAWKQVNERLNQGIASLSAQQWLERHSAVSEADFALEPLRNRLSILLTRTNHLSYHLGQAVLAPR